MKSVSLLGLVLLSALLGTPGCGPSRSQQANAQVEQLTREAARHLETGRLDEARQAIDEALAVEGATQSQQTAALAKRIEAECRRRETEQFHEEATEALKRAVAIGQEGRPEAAVALVAKSVPRASATQQALAQALLERVQQTTADRSAMQYWQTFDLVTLTDFREKDRLPNRWQSAVEDGPPHGDALRQLWRLTLQRTLPDALAAAETRSEAIADPDHSLPTPTIEEVAANPKPWYDKQVQFDRVWIHGRLHTTTRQGHLMTVTSPAGKVYGPYIEDGRLVFATYGDVAGQLESLIPHGKKMQGRVFCKITRGRRSGPVKMTSFTRVIVSKVELYSEAPNKDARR